MPNAEIATRTATAVPHYLVEPLICSCVASQRLRVLPFDPLHVFR
jgi:hypothetical protein